MCHPIDSNNKGYRKYPFAHMRLDDHTVLDTIEGRFECSKCKRSRKFFCYSCYIPVGELAQKLPQVQLPLNIDIIKHKKEIDGKSTAAHAAVLATKHVRVHIYPHIPDYRQEENVVLIYPSTDSSTVTQLFNEKVYLKNAYLEQLPKGHNAGTLLRERVQEVLMANKQAEQNQYYTCQSLPIQRAVFIDSTWNQSRSIYQDERVKALRHVLLQHRASQFWRHQKGSPRWYLATVEAIHQFLLEVHVNAWGLNPHYRGLDNLELAAEFFKSARLLTADTDNLQLTAPYNGQYDNLMFFFANMYDLIHRYYDHNELKSYRRPI